MHFIAKKHDGGIDGNRREIGRRIYVMEDNSAAVFSNFPTKILKWVPYVDVKVDCGLGNTRIGLGRGFCFTDDDSGFVMLYLFDWQFSILILYFMSYPYNLQCFVVVTFGSLTLLTSGEGEYAGTFA